VFQCGSMPGAVVIASIPTLSSNISLDKVQVACTPRSSDFTEPVLTFVKAIRNDDQNACALVYLDPTTKTPVPTMAVTLQLRTAFPMRGSAVEGLSRISGC
jgi:hypothetical protein